MAKNIKVEKSEETGLTFEEAMENLSTIADMKIEEKSPLGILHGTKLINNDEEFQYKEVEWLFPEDDQDFLEKIKPSFKACLNCLKELYNNPLTNWNDLSIKQGIESMMALTVDSANKLNQYLLLFNKKVDFTKTDEFSSLQKFYIDNISLKVSGKIEEGEVWFDKWLENKEGEILDLDKSGLKDFSVIAADKHYELFYIKNVDNQFFFSPNLIRNVKLFAYFDQTFETEDDFFHKIKALNNKDTHLSAKQILKDLEKSAKSFYKQRFDWKNNHLAGSLNKSFIALMLAANSVVYAKSESYKNSSQYFNDFKYFLRECFKTEEYAQALALPDSKKDTFLVSLTHKIAFALFSRLGGVKQEVIGYIHRIIRKGKNKEELKEEDSLWNHLMEADVNLRTYLKRFPNGPLLKLIEELEMAEDNRVFDPMMQENVSQKLFKISSEGKTVDVFRLPCPTTQNQISKAEVVAEFLGFLRDISSRKEKFLLVNLQDTTSWVDSARAKNIIDLHKIAEFDRSVKVISFSKDSAFYNQIGAFAFMNDASLFIEKFQEELLSSEDRGFFIPVNLRKNVKFIRFISDLCHFIHEIFFLEKKDLSRQERKDFIELFSHFLILKIIELENPSGMSFISKDGIDTGNSMSFSFFSFIKLLSSPRWKKEDKDFLFWLIYEPALLIRQRAIEPETLIRQISAMALLESRLEGLKTQMKKIYSLAFLKDLAVRYFF